MSRTTTSRQMLARPILRQTMCFIHGKRHLIAVKYEVVSPDYTFSIHINLQAEILLHSSFVYSKSLQHFINVRLSGLLTCREGANSANRHLKVAWRLSIQHVVKHRVGFLNIWSSSAWIIKGGNLISHPPPSNNIFDVFVCGIWMSERKVTLKTRCLPVERLTH